MDPEEVDVELPVPASPDSASSPEKPITPPRTYLEPVRDEVIKKEKEAREITREKAKETPPLVQERAPVQSPTANQPVQYSLQQRQEEQADEVADTQETSNDEVSVEMPLVVETKPQAKMAAPLPAQRPLALAAPVPAQRPLPQVPIEVPKNHPPSWTQQVSPAQCLPQQSSFPKSYYPDEVDVEIDVAASPVRTWLDTVGPLSNQSDSDNFASHAFL
ncbi:hypothetical protein ANCCAN_07021 [Ancylostoma caninum]|uniref:Uncharacterized protein n=1 Tax=Ancylostoma caninum TaxID=29170 RepID=A0A368GRI4_ANCCA|nr:hypothetical protein ANCCAN_07021 [Ancylostoma caninum]